MGRLWERLKDKNFYLTGIIIVLGNMLLNSTVSNFISSKINIGVPWVLEGISMFIITIILLLLSLEVFEI